ncbi:hemolysin type calcium-binding protein [Litoreibacter ponti]|uniref:Hemolysin type calcium-binding protein n=1 Tax=Litoreibacter ponti TaxID=1510457 RepID=A0A2T6BFN0_9RHOB|nr:hypothetical protein [Litoreibacter ponti]PTX54875.1 hemolysin type calcium-binding protein [Litoreibacter ponti]
MLGILALIVGSLSFGLTALPSLAGGNSGDDPSTGPDADLEPFTDQSDLVVSDEHADTLEDVLAEFDDSLPDPTRIDGALRIDTGAGDDVVVGGGEADIIAAGDGDDLVAGGAGNDRVDLGHGDDTYGLNPFLEDYEPEHLRALGLLELGDDTVRGGAGNDTLSDRFGANRIIGNQGADLLIGLDDDSEAVPTPDLIRGGFGNDTIHADEGDTVQGGRGADTITLYLPPAIGDAEPQPIIIEDFVANLDSLDLDGLDDASDVTIRDIEDGSGAEILLYDKVVARVLGGADLTLAEIGVTAG